MINLRRLSSTMKRELVETDKQLSIPYRNQTSSQQNVEYRHVRLSNILRIQLWVPKSTESLMGSVFEWQQLLILTKGLNLDFLKMGNLKVLVFKSKMKVQSMLASIKLDSYSNMSGTLETLTCISGLMNKEKNPAIISQKEIFTQTDGKMD